ncbi:MAG: DNA polymerase [Patescibacteria group bacterium]|nr:DNA polymerase [Patescibacteria group bacterium]
MKTLLLIDAHALIHRSFHALPNLTNKDGAPSGAIYGLSIILLKIFKENPHDYAAVFFDRPEPTFRKKLYEDYKIHRPKAPDELVAQLIEARNLFEIFGVKKYEMPGYEADDLIGVMARKLENEKDLKIIILTGDLDTLQLVKDDKIVVETLKKGVSETIIYNEDAVMQRYGISPNQIPDYKGLVGDPSDNILGVKGIGPKTATMLIQKYESVEKIFELFKEKEISGSIPEKERNVILKVLENKEQVLLSKHLATINCDAPVEIKNISELKYEGVATKNLISYFAKMGFQSLIKRISQKLAKETPPLNGQTGDGQTKKSGQQTFFKISFPVASKKITDEIEKPLTPILKEMEEWGIKIDLNVLEKMELKINGELSELTKKIHKEVNVVFNINSPKQLLEILKEKFGLKIKSTNFEKLVVIRGKIPFADLVLKYRELFKLKSTCLEPFKKLTQKDGRIHPTFVQDKALTGRITCENPNLQNIPESIREIFVTDKGYKLASFDYSQIELRILASLAQVPKMLDAFENDLDIHQMTASNIFNVSEENVTSQMRKTAKTLNFGIVYGMGARAFGRQSGLPQEEAKKFIKEYFKDFPEIKKWQEIILTRAREKGFVENLNGRTRALPEILSFNPRVQSEAERMAINFPIQSLAADIIKMAMAKVKQELEKKNFWGENAKMLLTIHDELIFEIRDDENLKEIINIISKTMESIYKLEVSLKINARIGDNWSEA